MTTDNGHVSTPRPVNGHGIRPTGRPRTDTTAEGGVEAALLDRLLRDRTVNPVLQPIVELETGSVAGYEALARGPVEHELHAPDALFAAARRAGRLAELDALCQQRALEITASAGLRPPAVLFVNVEPETLPFPDLSPPVDAAGMLTTPRPSPELTTLLASGVAVIVELTERALLSDPAGLLVFSERVRALGCGIALDDVDAEPSTLALLPVLQPDVVKLDLRLIQSRPDAAIAQTMTAVTAYAESHHAVIVAEGVETAEHEAVARSLGATHGQGWRYGRPAAPTPDTFVRSALWRPIVPRTHRAAVRRSAFALASHSRRSRQASKRLLIEISLLLERQAAQLDGLAVVLGTFEVAHHFGRSNQERYAHLARHAALVCALGSGITDEPAPGVRGAHLGDDDPVRHEWDLVVLGPHFAVALSARDLGDTGPESERRFDYVLTYDRPTVLEIARTLLGRVEPRRPAGGQGLAGLDTTNGTALLP